VRYKATTKEQCDTAAEAWDRWAPTLQQWLGTATELTLDMANVRRGSSVLDVAAGAGDQTLHAAKRVGSEGFVLATDISPKILEFAALNARNMGYKNIRTRVMGGENIDIARECLARVVSERGATEGQAVSRKLDSLPGGRYAGVAGRRVSVSPCLRHASSAATRAVRPSHRSGVRRHRRARRSRGRLLLYDGSRPCTSAARLEASSVARELHSPGSTNPAAQSSGRFSFDGLPTPRHVLLLS